MAQRSPVASAKKDLRISKGNTVCQCIKDKLTSENQVTGTILHVEMLPKTVLCQKEALLSTVLGSWTEMNFDLYLTRIVLLRLQTHFLGKC